jgi:YVTN family beta-propeller protein
MMHTSHPSRRLVNRRAFLREAGRLASGLAVAGASGWTAAFAAVPRDRPPAGALDPGATADGTRRTIALLANSLSNTLTIVDARTFEPFRTMPVGREPHKFHLSLSGRTVYSCSTTSNEMIEIELATLRPLRHIPILDPYNVTFTGDGRHLFKLAYRYTFVEVHDARTFRRIRRLQTGSAPSHFALTPDGRWFINSNQHSNTVSVIDTSTLRVAHLLAIDPFPAGVSVSHDGHYVFVSSGTAGTICILETGEWRLVKRVHSGRDAHEHIMTRDGTHIFITNRGEDTTSVFDVAAQRVVEKFRVPGGPDMPMLSADGRHLWVSGRYGDIGTVVDARTLRIIRTFRTERSPHGVFLGVTEA